MQGRVAVQNRYTVGRNLHESPSKLGQNNAFVKHRSSVQARLAAPKNTVSPANRGPGRFAGSAGSAARCTGRGTKTVQGSHCTAREPGRVAPVGAFGMAPASNVSTRSPRLEAHGGAS